MRYIVVLYTLAIVACTMASISPASKAEQPGNSYHNRHLEDLLRQKLLKFGDAMKLGYHSLGIEAMDPTVLEDTDVSSIFGGDVFKMVFTNVRVNDLSRFVVSDVKADVYSQKVDLSVIIPNVTAAIQYHVSGTLFGVFPLSGSGNCTVVYEDVTMSATARLQSSNGMVQFTQFDDSDVDYASECLSIEESRVATEGGLESQVGRVLFWTFAKQIGRTLPSEVLRYMNDALRRAPRPFADESSTHTNFHS